MLHKLRWELSSTTPLDYLDHLLPRLCLPGHIDLPRLRMKTETIIALACTHDRFYSLPASLLAAASILTALRSCNTEPEDSALGALLRVTKGGRRAEAGLGPKVLRDTRLCLQILTHSGAEALEQCCSSLNHCLPNYLTGHLSSGPPSPDTTQSTLDPASGEDGADSAPSSLSPSSLDVFSDLNSSVLQTVLGSADQSFSSILVT